MARILAIYLDMFCSEYLHVGNKNFPETSIEYYLKKLGGTIYINCYTPAPDTGRSAACMWSGCYPKENGCDDRYKWPRYYLRTSKDLFSVLKNSGYTLDIFCDEIYYHAGLFSASVHMDPKEKGTFLQFLKKERKEEKLFRFLYIPDMHHVLSTEGYTITNYKKACDFSCRIIKDIFSHININSYDNVIIFGDHGFVWDSINTETRVLSKGRTKTGVFIRSRNNNGFRVDNGLHSISDIYATVLDFAGVAYEKGSGDSISFVNGEHDFVLMEDHLTIYPSIGDPIGSWQVVTQANEYWVGVDGVWQSESPLSNFDTQFWDNILNNKMTSYAEMRNLWIAQQKYLDSCGKKETVYGGRLKLSLRQKLKRIFFGIVRTFISAGRKIKNFR